MSTPKFWAAVNLDQAFFSNCSSLLVWVLKKGGFSIQQLWPKRIWNNSDLTSTWSLGRDTPITVVLSVYSRFMRDASHELGWSEEEKRQGVCSLHRRDAYPNTSTNSWDGDLVVQGSVGTKTVWAQAQDSSLFYLSDSDSASRGNPCLK